MSLWSDLSERLRALVFRRREERELDDELRFHTEMDAERRKRSGVDAAEARRQSAIALGGVEQVKEEVRDARGTRGIENILSDISYAIRGLRKNPGFALVAILTIAIGVGGTTAVFSAVDAVLLTPLPYEQPGQLVQLYQYEGDSPYKGYVSPVHFLAYRSQLSSMEGVAGILTYNTVGADIGGADRPERIRLLPVSADYFNVVRAQPVLGRGFLPEEENGARTVVLSHALWERIFHGDPSALGAPFLMSGAPYTVVGVMPAGFTDPLVGNVDAWTPMDLTEGLNPQRAMNHWVSVVARLRAGVTIERAQRELDQLSATLRRELVRGNRAAAVLYPLKEEIVGSASRSLILMLGAAALVLVLVCVNIANLLLVRASERDKEFAVRSALGAGRGRLVRQLLTESIVLAVAGDIAGLLVARAAMSGIVAIGAGSIPRLTTLSLNPRLLAFSIAIATLSAIAFGLAPALRAARTEPGDVLRQQARGASRGGAEGRFRSALVISQVALAFVLLVGAGLLIESFRKIQDLDLGVAPDKVLTFDLELPAARYDSTARGRFYEEFARRVEAIPGVRAAGGISKLPATGNYHQWGTTALTGPLVGAQLGNRGDINQRIVSGDYFRAAGIKVLEGRVFDAGDVMGAPDRVVISQSFAKVFYPGVDPVGQRLSTGLHDSDVIGVVADVAIDPEGDPAYYVYHPHTQWAGDRNWALAQVIATDGPPIAAEAAVRRVLASLDPQLVMYRPTTLAEAIGQGTATRVFTLRILIAFALVALVLSALGLFGVLAYTVRLRARELGIRMALGAGTGTIRRMILRQGLTIAAVGIGFGLVGAAALTRLMASLVFRMNPLDPGVLVVAVVFMGLVAAVAAYLPAYRATAVDPREVLQAE
ncbi:MAG TPA: ABC transporter permease [Gemmatimonadales bacterium]|nr:ABC transporter permease [Gemmatimonadales bacterium]